MLNVSWIIQELCVHTEDVENDEGEAQEFLDTLKENMNENEGCMFVIFLYNLRDLCNFV